MRGWGRFIGPALVWAAAGSGPAFGAGRTVLFVLDVSGSMAAEAGPGVTALQKAVGVIVDQVGDSFSGRAGLVTFGGNCAASTRVDLGIGNEREILEHARSALPDGATPLYEAIKQAGEILARSGGGEVVLLSDGMDTCGHAGEEIGLVKSLREAGTLTRLDVAIVDPFVMAELQALASAGGGTSWLLAAPAPPVFEFETPPDVPVQAAPPKAPFHYERSERYAPPPVDPSSFPRDLEFGNEARKGPSPAKSPAPARRNAQPLPEIRVLPLN